MAQPERVGNGRSREYELIYLMRPDVTPENARKIATRVEEVTAREGGKLTLVETWGRRGLAYAVQNFRRGVYVYVKYVGEGNLVSELERNLRMLDEVLKYQTVALRAGLDVRDVAVNPDDIKFEEIQPPPEDEEELTRERILGLEPPGERAEEAGPRGRDDEDDDEAEGEAAVAKEAVEE